MLPTGQKVARVLTEYYHAGLDYYFLTGRDGDKAALDQVPAWARTGKEVRVFGNAQLAHGAAGEALLCRSRARWLARLALLPRSRLTN